MIYGMTTDLGAMIRHAREVAGLSQMQLARSVGIHQSNIGRWERNETRPTDTAAARAMEVLDIDPEEWKAALEEPAVQIVYETDVATAIRADKRLAPAAKAALISLYGLLVRDQHEVALDERLGDQVEHEEAANGAAEDTPDRPTLCLG